MLPGRELRECGAGRMSWQCTASPHPPGPPAGTHPLRITAAPEPEDIKFENLEYDAVRAAVPPCSVVLVHSAPKPLPWDQMSQMGRQPRCLKAALLRALLREGGLV